MSIESCDDATDPVAASRTAFDPRPARTDSRTVPRSPRRSNTTSPDEAVRREWLRRAQAEYRSSAITAQVSLWLLQLGAPPALIREGLRIVNDELKHAELSYRVYVGAGGVEVVPIARELLGVSVTHAGLENDLARIATQVFCLGETAAVRLFHRMRLQCSVPVARTALDRILRDEARHRDFGWALLEWLLTLSQGPELRAQVERNVPTMIASLIRNYGGTPDESPSSAEASEPDERASSNNRAWGLIPRAEYRQAIALCIQRDLRPRFAKLNIACDDPARS